jgi:hypothetical protein
MNPFSLFTILAGCCSTTLAAQFQNLDFEEYDPATLKLPGWHLFNAATPQNENVIGLDELANPPYASMFTPDLPSGGKYALGLYSLGDFAPWFVSQTGEIPSDAKSMSFELYTAQVSLRFDETEMPLSYFARTDVGLRGWNFVDVSAFAGRTVTMEIKATGITGPHLPGGTGLDNFVFSAQPVPPIPEPRTLALFVFGAVLAFLHWRSSKAPR